MATLTTEQLFSTPKQTMTTEELFAPKPASDDSSGALNNIDPEIWAKKTTTSIFSEELGLDYDAVTASYNSIVKNVFGESMKPSQVQKRMVDMGILSTPESTDEEIKTFATAAISGDELPQDLLDKRYKKETVRQTAQLFGAARKADDDLFSTPSEWLDKVNAKPDMPGVITGTPIYNDDDILNVNTYKSLIERMPSKQGVDSIRAERKALMARIYYDTVNEQADYFSRKETPVPLNKNPKLSALSMGLYSAATTIERGLWGTSTAVGMEWNSPELERTEERLEEIGVAWETMPGKMSFVIGTVSESIPNFGYNMAVGNMGIFTTEYGNSYSEAINNGATELQANAIALTVATINTMIEGMQLNHIAKMTGIGKSGIAVMKKSIKDKAYKAFLKKGAKFTGDMIVTSFNEGVEGWLQEGVQIAMPAWVIGIYPKDADGNTDWSNILGQMNRSFIGEGIGGAFLGGAGSVYNSKQISTYKTSIASKIMIQEGLDEKQSLFVATNIVERLRNNDGNPQDVMREELGKVKMADNRHKASAHIIKKGKEMSDKQYRKIAMDTVGKNSIKNMNHDEAERFITALKQAEVEVEPAKEGEVEKKEVTPEQIVKDVEAIRDETEPQPQEYDEAERETTILDKALSLGKKEFNSAEQADQFVEEIAEIAKNQNRDVQIDVAPNNTVTVSDPSPAAPAAETPVTPTKAPPAPLEAQEGAKPAQPVTEGKATPKGFRKGFLDNAPIGNEEKLRQKLEELIGDKPKPKKAYKKDVEKEPTIAPTKAAIGQSLQQAGKGIDRAFGMLSTRLKNISLGLFQDVRNKYINPTLTTVADRVKVAHGLVDTMRSELSTEDKRIFDNAVWQANDDIINTTIAKYGLQDQYAAFREMMDIIYHEAKAVGMDLAYLDVYFPSMVKDFDGLMDELNRREKYEPIVMAMMMATDKKGRPLSRDEQAQMINSLLRGYQSSGIALGRPGFAKERTVLREDLSLKKYYYGFEEAISRYIESMTENIHARQFFGKTTAEVVKLRAGMSRAKTNIARYQKDKSKDQTANIKRARTRIAKLQAELDIKDDGSLSNSIGAYVLDLIESGEIKYGQQKELLQIFEGIFKTTQTDKWLQTLKSIEYAGSLAQVSAVITQYGEVILPLLYAPGSMLPNFVKAHLNKSDIKLSDIGVAHIGQEWVDADLDGIVKKLMKPFELADRVGKETYVNSIVNKYRKMAVKNPDKARTEIRKYYPETGVESVLNSLKSGEVDDNVKGFALNELADVQPISKMEVPELYAKAGNLRVVYMYKTFVLKRIDILRREGFAEITKGVKSGDKERIVKGLARLIWLSFMFTLADSSMDVVKDFVKGKPIDKIENYVIDNFLQMMMTSKYTAQQFSQEGFGSFLRGNIALPVSNVDSAMKDLMTLMDEDSEKGSEFARRIPWVGDMYYWWFGEGARKIDEGVYDDN